MIFDAHAHYLDHAFDQDRTDLLNRLFDTSVEGIIEAGTTLETSRKVIALAEQFPRVWAAVGIHPEEAKETAPDYLSTLRTLASHPKAVAIGEIGLDYHYEEYCPRDIQQSRFREQVLLANELNLPVVIHDREAHEDTLQILKEFRPRGVVHCFSGSAEMAKEVLRLDMYIGLGGVVTFKNARKAVEAAQLVPLDRLLLETDAPYLAPVPVRGHRCDSSHIYHTASLIARWRGISTEQLLRITSENAKRLYALDY